MATYLICEGDFDKQILGEVLINKQNISVTIETAYGSGNLSKMREEYERKNKNNRAYSIKDRDYRISRNDADRKWQKATSKSLIWRRHEIENYLLNNIILHQAFSYLNLSESVSLTQKLPLSRSDIDELLKELARRLLTEHIKHCVCWQVSVATAIGSLPCDETLIGSLEDDYLEKLDMLLQSRQQACDNLSTKITQNELSVRTIYETFQTQFNRSQFWDSGDFLYEMKGKRLVTELCSHINGLIGEDYFSVDMFKEEVLLESFKTVLKTETYQLDQDFVDLANHLQHS